MVEHMLLFDFVNMPSILPPLCFHSMHVLCVKLPFLARDTAHGPGGFQAKLEFYFLWEEIVKHSWLIKT